MALVKMNRIYADKYLDLCRTTNPEAKNDPQIFAKMLEVMEADPWLKNRYPLLIAGLGALNRIELTVEERRCFLGVMAIQVALDTHNM